MRIRIRIRIRNPARYYISHSQTHKYGMLFICIQSWMHAIAYVYCPYIELGPIFMHCVSCWMANLDDCGRLSCMCIIIGGTFFPGNKLWRIFFSLQASGSKFFMRQNIAYHRSSWLILCECNTNIISESIQFGLYGSWFGDFVTDTATSNDD